MSEEITDSTWNKMCRDSKKAGYREGAADGREEVFQKSFDRGYQNGFKNGYLLGKYKGALSSENIKIAELEHSKRGNCVLCSSISLLEEDLATVSTTQIQNTNNLLSEIHSRSSQKIVIPIEKTLD